MLSTNSVGMPTSSIMTGLLTQRKKMEFAKNTSQMFLRPTEEGKFYRLRLLQFSPDEKFVNSSNFAHYRDFPFIIQHIHTFWQEIPTDDPEKPRRVMKSIVCPQTDYVKANSTLTKAQCPMCSAYGSAWKAYTDSKYKNQEAKNKMKNLHNTFRALVPVYVVNDPNYESNNGAVKVLALDEDMYHELITQINAAQRNNTPIWNIDACDLFFTYGKVDKTVNAGKPNEYTFKKNGFSRIGFTTAAKHLDGLTEDLVESLQFDANWYTVPTKEDLDAFYMENYSSANVSNDDIPMDIPSVATPKKVVASTPVAPAPVVTESVKEDIPAPAPKKEVKKEVKKDVTASIPDEDLNSKIDDILAGMTLP